MGAPMGLAWYWYVNPWYLKHLIPRMFPGFTKNFTPWKKIWASMIFDNIVGCWFMLPLFVYVLSLATARGRFVEAYEGFKRRIWPTIKLSYATGPISNLFLYAMVPQFIRHVVSMLIRIPVGMVFSYVQHNY